MRELRLSVTDRCNFRCTYCMPRSKLGLAVPVASKRRLLDFDELTRIAEAFIQLGVKKIRLTGGEPLVRCDLHKLVAQLARLSPEDLCLTTNGSLLAAQAPLLRDAGLNRVTVSLDALDEPTFQRATAALQRLQPEQHVYIFGDGLCAKTGPEAVDSGARA